VAVLPVVRVTQKSPGYSFSDRVAPRILWNPKGRLPSQTEGERPTCSARGSEGTLARDSEAQRAEVTARHLGRSKCRREKNGDLYIIGSPSI